MSNSTDSTSSDSRSPGTMTGSIIGRIAAVLGFLALGTFAVIYSMSEPAAIGQAPSGEGGDENPAAETEVNQSLFTSGGGANNSEVIPASHQQLTGSGATGPAASRPPGIDINPAPGGTSGSLNLSPLQNRSANTQVVGRQTIPSPPTQSFGAANPASGGGLNLRNPLQGAADAAGQIGGDIRSGVTNATNAAIENTRQTTGNIVQNAREAINGATGSAGNLLNGNPANPAVDPTLRPGTFGSPPPARQPVAQTQTNPPRNTIGSPSVTTPDPLRATPPSGLRAQAPIRPVTPAPTNNRFGAAPGTTQQRTTSPPSGQSIGAGLPTRPGQTSPPTSGGFAPRGGSNPLATGGSPTNPGINRGGTTPPPRSRVPAIPASTSPRAVAAGATLATPGDRSLEGVQSPAISLERLAPREIQVNSPAEFAIVVRNTGKSSAHEVQITDRIPSGAEFLSADPQPQRSGTDGLIWQLGEIRPGQEKRIEYRLRPTRPGEIGSVAHFSFASRASMRTMVTKPELRVTHSARPQVMIGDDVVLDITVQNTGDGAAYDVVVQENVPAQLLIPGELQSPDGSRGIEYPVGTLRPGQSKTLQLSLKSADIGRMRNILTATSKGVPDATHAIDIEVIAPVLAASASGPRKRFINREATHVLSVINNGTAPAENVELIARLPEGLRFVGANNRGRYEANSHAVFWSLAELPEQLPAEVELTTVPTQPGEQRIQFETFADLGRKATAEQVVLVDHLVDIYFEIDDVVDLIEIGSETSYRIRLVNQGTIAASGVNLQIDFPPGIQPTSVDSNLPNQIQGNRVVFSPITSISPGDEIRLEVKAVGRQPGDHRVAAHVQTAGRETPVTREETTRVYNDR